MSTTTEIKCESCNDTYELENGDGCAECCDHSDMDEGFCLLCGEDRREDLMARAYDYAKASYQD